MTGCMFRGRIHESFLLAPLPSDFFGHFGKGLSPHAVFSTLLDTLMTQNGFVHSQCPQVIHGMVVSYQMTTRLGVICHLTSIPHGHPDLFQAAG